MVTQFDHTGTKDPLITLLNYVVPVTVQTDTKDPPKTSKLTANLAPAFIADICVILAVTFEFADFDLHNGRIVKIYLMVFYPKFRLSLLCDAFFVELSLICL